MARTTKIACSRGGSYEPAYIRRRQKLQRLKLKYSTHCAKCQHKLEEKKQEEILEEGEVEDDGTSDFSDSEPIARAPVYERKEELSSIATDSEPEDDKKKKKTTFQARKGLRYELLRRHGHTEESGEDMEISDDEPVASSSTSSASASVAPKKSPIAITVQPSVSLRLRSVQSPNEEKQVDEGVEVDMDEDEEKVEDEDADDSDYAEDEDGTTQIDLESDSETELITTEDDDAFGQPSSEEFLRLMPRTVLEKIVQRLLKPPQSPQTRRVVQSLIQESMPDTLAAYDTSVRIKVNETFTTMVQEMQEQHSSLTSDDFADVMARFLRNEVRVLQSFPGSAKRTFELILYIAEHSFGDLELDNRKGFGERTNFDKTADRALLYVAEQRLEDEGASFRAVIPGYLETIRAHAMILYRHGIHPKFWFPATTTFLQASLQVNSAKTLGRLRSQTRTKHPFQLGRIQDGQ